MKILVFAPYYPPHIGGLESYAQDLNKHLSKKVESIVVFTPQIPLKALSSEKNNNIEIIRFPAFEIISNYSLPKFWNPRFWKLFFQLFKNDFDLVLSHTRFFNSSLMALLYSKIKKVKWAHIEHGSSFVIVSSKLTSAISKCYDLIFGKIVFKFSSVNISVSEAVRSFVKKFDRKRISPILYRGLELSKIDSLPANDLGNNYKNLIVVFAGRLYKWKGVENSIKAIQELPEKIKENNKFVIIGDGEDYERLMHMTGKEIVMMGSMSWEKVISILKAADIYIHSALPGGGLSTSLLEAMYCQCAIIATPNEGAKEIIEGKNNGILIKEPYIENITKNLIILIKDKEKIQKIAKNAKLFASKQCNWESSVKRFFEIIKNNK